MSDKAPNLRQRQAEHTRREILDAARRLFAERGYSRTTVRDIAEAAGVSSQTVYDSIGSKQALVARLNDLIDAEAGIAAKAATGTSASDPLEVVATQARVVRSILEHCGDIVHTLVTGAAAEPDLDAVLTEGHRRHMLGATAIVARLEQLGALGPQLDGATAVDTLAAVCDIRVGLMLLDSYGWSLDRMESWMTATSRTLLLATA